MNREQLNSIESQRSSCSRDNKRGHRRRGHLSGESTSDLFNYYSEVWYDTFGVQPALNDFVEENGWYFEWHDAGTIMMTKTIATFKVTNSTGDLIKMYSLTAMNAKELGEFGLAKIIKKGVASSEASSYI
jgi:hypothetical protein